MPCTHMLRTAAVLASVLCVPAFAIEQDASRQSYYVVSAPLSDVLSLITTDTGIDVDFNPASMPYVTSTALSGSGRELITELTREFNLSMFEFNGRIYLSAADDQQTRIITNDVHTAAQIRDAIAQSGIDLRDFKVGDTANPNAIVLTAPAKLIGIVEALVTSLPPVPPGRTSREIVVMRGI